jgi:hypothetical protein
MTRGEFRVGRAHEQHPVDDRRGTVLMLPGRAYPCSMVAHFADGIGR